MHHLNLRRSRSAPGATQNSSADVRLKRLVGFPTDDGRPESPRWLNKKCVKQLPALIGHCRVRPTREAIEHLNHHSEATAIVAFEPILRSWRNARVLTLHSALNLEALAENYGYFMAGVQPYRGAEITTLNWFASVRQNDGYRSGSTRIDCRAGTSRWRRDSVFPSAKALTENPHSC